MIKINDVSTNLLLGNAKNAKLWGEYVDKFIKKMRARFSLTKEEGEKIKKKMTNKEDPLLKLAIKNYKEMFPDKSNSDAVVGGGAKKKSRRRKKKKRTKKTKSANKTKKRYQMGGEGGQEELMGFLTILVGILGVSFALYPIGRWLGLIEDPAPLAATTGERKSRREFVRLRQLSDEERLRLGRQASMSHRDDLTAYTHEQQPRRD